MTLVPEQPRQRTVLRRIIEVLSPKRRSTGRRQGLRKLSPDFIVKAWDETASQVTRIGLTFVGTAAFCLLSLLTPDSALLGGSEKINVPLAGMVSFFGFILLGPALLIGLRIYLQIYIEHSERLERLARSMSAVRVPTLLPFQNSLIRLLSNLTRYLLLPVAYLNTDDHLCILVGPRGTSQQTIEASVYAYPNALRYRINTSNGFSTLRQKLSMNQMRHHRSITEKGHHE